MLLMMMMVVVMVIAEEPETRTQKALSIFTVVKFPNTACSSATTGRNGTCYTTSECQAKGGSSSGSCASSFGVCCIFEKSCQAGTIAENCTYFTSSALTKGSSCSLTVCKCSSDVCQLRLDFETFVLNDPVTATTITVGPVNADGTPVAGSATRQGNCDTDSFGVTVPGGKSPPLICGTNTGQHMYVPASDTGCNTLNGNIGAASTAGTSAFTIKVTQVECGSKRLAPSGCLQYFTQDTGEIQTFNYNSGNGVHLANQDYSACVRDNREFCAICYWTPTAAIGFGLSVPNAIAGIAGLDTNCGVPGLLGTYVNGGSYDHVVIPGGQCEAPSPTGAAVANTFSHDRYCNTQLGCGINNLGTMQAAAGAGLGTVCTNQKPFKIDVLTDGLEYHQAATSEAVAPRNQGISLNYYMKSTCLFNDNE